MKDVFGEFQKDLNTFNKTKMKSLNVFEQSVNNKEEKDKPEMIRLFFDHSYKAQSNSPLSKKGPIPATLRRKSKLMTVNYQKKCLLHKNPETSIEKIVKILKSISDKLRYYEEAELVEQNEWVIRELLNNNIYNYNFEDETSEFIQKMGSLQLFNQYSNSNYVSQDLTLNNKNSSTHSLINLSISPEIPSTPLRLSHSSLSSIPLNFEDLGPEFDIFSYSNEVNERTLWNVTNLVFSYKKLSDLLKKSKFYDYVQEIYIGYSSSNTLKYHNVILFC
jgi:hypothetical protein